MNTRQQARSLFPSWPRRRQARWVLARLHVAQYARPAFARLLPMTMEQCLDNQPRTSLAPRTLREARQ